MVNVTPHAAFGARADLLSGLAQARLVNSGQDTTITFGDGSSIVLKGVACAAAVFAALAEEGSKPSPIGADISGDG